jgi:hypothetical protein
MLVPLCEAPKFTALNNDAVELMIQFCGCPTAKTLISSISEAIPIEVDVGNFPTASTLFNYDDVYKKTDTKIEIPENQINDRLSLLAYEIFNVKGNEQQEKYIVGAAEAGEMNIDLYAQEKELLERNVTKNLVQLLQKCQTNWDIEESAIEKYQDLFKFDEKDYLIYQDVTCHTDRLRLEWIEYYQNKYCKKHPEDIGSCQRTHLCDYHKLKQLPKEESRQYILARLCSVFSSFSQQAKQAFTPLVTKFCPEELDQVPNEMKNEL